MIVILDSGLYKITAPNTLLQSSSIFINSSFRYLYNPVIVRRALACLLLLLMYSAAWATPPTNVFRVDERPPSEIFKNGFNKRGQNDYLLAHVLGTSLMPGSEGSFFVATTATLETAYLIAQRRYQYNPALQTSPLYIYEIRADQNFYEVDLYMENMEENPPEGESRINIARARQAYRYQREWVAAGGIGPQLIRRARQIHFEGGRIIDDHHDFENGGIYADADTHANAGIYPRLGLQTYHRVLGGRAFILNSTVDFLRGFAVSLAYCPPVAERRIKRQVGGCDNPTVIYPYTDLTGLTEIYPLLLNEE